eukprot:gnl/MRDRNA2_/MRDRNA2_72920_c0_seq1.p1 gnl/MRDRNA2_/MRDRNA2_72920_c0~~gnl/MRDRNA2_/MRDRNA2_72920_c0_seq1.p1  ORF type:complete len:673 (+),score=137.15 gnl/MRDRNA2_/MRDRNA2_72920_c0_seq1:101-2119(+)
MSASEFDTRKRQILSGLDKSPKGSIDAPIVDLLNFINAQDGVVSTSSCSGRVSLFLGGQDQGKGGEWLLASHAVVDTDSTWSLIHKELERRRAEQRSAGTLLMFLHEPMVLHLECVDVTVAGSLLAVARESGFRESGMSVGVARGRVMLAVRTTALRLEAPVAIDGDIVVDELYFKLLCKLANEMFRKNADRTAEFFDRVKLHFEATSGQPVVNDWALVCAKDCAKTVKVAVEKIGWMDKGRQMAAIQLEGPSSKSEQVSASSCSSNGVGSASPSSGIGVPITSAAADFLLLLHEEAGGRGTAWPAHAEVLQDLWCQQVVSLSHCPQLPITNRGNQKDGCHKGYPISNAGTRTSGPVEDELLALVSMVDGSADGLPSRGDVKKALASMSPSWRGDSILLPRGTLCGEEWQRLDAVVRARGEPGLWESMRKSFGARLLGRQCEIEVGDGLRKAQVHILAGADSDTWVVVDGPPESSLKYTFDLTKCMFSEGNASEKQRVFQEWDVQDTVVLDMYTGIGYWALPMLKNGAAKVFAAEWNPDAIEAFKKGLQINGLDDGRCEVLAGDNRSEETRSKVRRLCDRVVLGLIPDCREGIPVACEALRDIGGLLHVHWNIKQGEEDMVIAEILKLIHKGLEVRSEESPLWHCEVLGVKKVKWYAPRVRHVVVDVKCKPA